MQEEQQLCTVCVQECDQLFQVAKCNHRFCKDCSVGYIGTQASNFSAASCLEQGCKALLDKSLPIYSLLDSETINKIQKFQSYLFLQQNPEYITCKMKDCPGVLRLKQGKCQTCKSVHCKKCANLSHQGVCVQSQEEAQMYKLNYRKCPNCRIWVQKTAGCQYINCKCKTQFCYRCGAQFSKDPCRKRKVWQNQVEIRKLMYSLRVKCPSDPKKVFVLVPRLLIVFLVLLPLTSLFLLVPFIIFGIAIVIALFMPITICQPISQMREPKCRCFSYIMLIVFYPVLSFLAMILFTLMILLYPFLRNKNHHGAYDPFDNGLSIIAVYYLRFVVWLVQCCAS